MTNPLFETAFQQATDALFVIKKRQILYANVAAEQLLVAYQVDLDKVIDVCEAKGCELHSTMTQCHNCEVKSRFDPAAFTLVLLTKHDKQETFSGSYQKVSDPDIYILNLRNVTMQDQTERLFHQKKLMAYVSRAHENERKKIAQDLHDGLAQSVFSILLEVRQTKRQEKLSPVLAEELSKIENHLVSTLDEIKRMALDLRPAALDDLGLSAAIVSLINRLEETTGIEIIFISQIQQPRFSESIEITLYRVLQESLMNAIKYAKVETINVLLVEREKKLVLEILDQGVGFKPEETGNKGSGMGLLHIEERVDTIDGKLTINSQPNQGTHIKIEVPL